MQPSTPCSRWGKSPRAPAAALPGPLSTCRPHPHPVPVKEPRVAFPRPPVAPSCPRLGCMWLVGPRPLSATPARVPVRAALLSALSGEERARGPCPASTHSPPAAWGHVSSRGVRFCSTHCPGSAPYEQPAPTVL